MDQAEEYVKIWESGRVTFNRVLSTIEEEHLRLRMSPETNSVGFLLRHIAETEHSFPHMFFGKELILKERFTVGPVKDEGKFTSGLEGIKTLLSEAHANIIQTILETNDWDSVIETRLGQMTKREAIGRMSAHTSYHTGQIAVILKYGK